VPSTADYVEGYSRPVNLGGVTAFVLRFCHNSHYPNDRRRGIGIQDSIICLHLSGVGNTLRRGDSKFHIFS
jgi:hypothetical protein